MIHTMKENGMELMAAYDDISDFFRRNNVIGKRIYDIRCTDTDYMIHNLSDFEEEQLLGWSIRSAVDTDGIVALLFEDGGDLEIRYNGEGPVMLGFGLRDRLEWDPYDGEQYRFSTLFQHCIGRRIAGIKFERSNRRMRFSTCRDGFDPVTGEPVYIDMAADDEGVDRIGLVLEDGTRLEASGNIDWFSLVHYDSSGEECRVPCEELLKDLTPERRRRLFEEKIDL